MSSSRDKPKLADKQLKLTIDTNLVNALQKLPEMNQIEELERQGRVKIVRTDVMDTELLGQKEQRPRELRLSKSSQFEEVIGAGVAGHSRAGHAVAGSDSDYEMLAKIRGILFPNFEQLNDDKRRKAQRDCMHLATHKRNDCDYFLTMDGIILKNKEALEKIGISVLGPSQFLDML